MDINSPNSNDAVIPPDDEVKPPVSTPIRPSLSTDLRTPSANKCPKPNSGTLAPAPAKSTNGLYSPIADKTTPITTYDTNILAGVSLV